MTNKKSSQSAKRLRKVFKRSLLVLSLALVVGGIVVAAMPKPVNIEEGKVVQQDFVVTVNEDGRTRVKDRYVVSAPLAGRVARIELDPGDGVKQGAVIVRMVPLQAPLLNTRSHAQAESRVAAARAGRQQAQAQIERARAALSFAKAEAERVGQLRKSNVVSQQEHDRAMLELRAGTAELTSAEFGAKVAHHELSMASAALGYQEKHDEGQTLTVTSPITGRVLKVIQESEGVVQAGAPLLEVGDPRALEIVSDVLTSDAVSIHPSSAVAVEEWGGKALSGVVRLIEPSAFTRLSALGVQEQRVNAIIDLTDPYEDWVKLGDGYRVETRIEVYRASKAILVPQSALFRRDGKWALFGIDGQAARLHFVEVGRRNERYVEVREGIQVGEAVILHPSDKVREGVEVVVRGEN